MSNEASADRMAKNAIGGRLHVCYMTQVPFVVIIGASAHSNNHRHPSINPVHVRAAPLWPRMYRVLLRAMLMALKSITRLCREFIWLLLKDLERMHRRRTGAIR